MTHLAVTRHWTCAILWSLFRDCRSHSNIIWRIWDLLLFLREISNVLNLIFKLLQISLEINCTYVYKLIIFFYLIYRIFSFSCFICYGVSFIHCHWILSIIHHYFDVGNECFSMPKISLISLHDWKCFLHLCPKGFIITLCF